MSFREAAMVECASDVAGPRYLPCGVETEGERQTVRCGRVVSRQGRPRLAGSVHRVNPIRRRRLLHVPDNLIVPTALPA
jgi:hypothetical protein